MNISTKLEDEHIDPRKPSKGYEWWYFDALSTDKKWGIAIIFYEGNPFSPKYIEQEGSLPSDFPGISISVYRNGKTEFYSFLEYKPGKFKWDEDSQSGSVGSNFFKKVETEEELVYDLLIDQTLDSGHVLSAKLKFISSKLADDLIVRESETEKHFWNLIQPQAQVNGSLIIQGKSDDHSVLFTGAGYHDHNTGHEPMKDSFEDWYWGRFHFKESTLIYYIMNGLDGKQQYEAWLVSKDGKEILSEFDHIELKYFTKNRFGLNSARKFELKSEKSSAIIQASKLLDNGPFYQRFLSDIVLQNGEEVLAGTGFSEYIKPSKIYEEKYWWMVRMRLRFLTEKPHWVQKSKMFYEWTW